MQKDIVSGRVENGMNRILSVEKYIEDEESRGKKLQDCWSYTGGQHLEVVEDDYTYY